MARLPIRYAKTSDGARIAFVVDGAGDRDLIELSSGGTTLSIDATDDQPAWRRYEERMASFSRLIRFDPRGIGLSDPIDPTVPPTLEQRAADVLAVLDAVASERVVLTATTSGAYGAMLLAATTPERVSALVLINCTARAVQAPDYPWGFPITDFKAAIDTQFDPDQEPAVDALTLVAPSRANDPRFREWWDTAGRRGASPSTARAQFQLFVESDMRGVLGSITAPTLVVHRRDNAFLSFENSVYLAEHIPGARYVEVPGVDHLPWLGDADALLDVVEEFVTGVRPRYVDADRVLATVLFTDIVDSTKRASELGDARWRMVLDDYDALVGRELDRFGGNLVKNTGDGTLATFDGPARAIRCALALRDGSESLGVELRAGVHTGEVERRHDDVGGIAVHIAARVEAEAGPAEVLVSRTVRDLVAGSGIEFTDRGTYNLKGVSEDWQLFAVDRG